MKDTYIHPSAIVEVDQIGNGTRVWAFTHLMKGATIGDNCNIGDHCFVESGAVIGNNVTIKNGNEIWEGVTLEDGVFVGPRVFFTNDLYPRSPRMAVARNRYSSRQWLQPTLVKRGASLGAGAVILAGVTLHDFCMVGAGAIVTKDIPAYALVIGTPARGVGWVCQCGRRLRLENAAAICDICGLSFTAQGNSLCLAREDA